MIIEITSKRHPDMSAFQYCAAIVKPAKDETCPHLKYIKVKDKEVFGTDGSRIHMARLSDPIKPEEEYENGLYKVVKRSSSAIVCIPCPESEENAPYPDPTKPFDILRPGLLETIEGVEPHNYASILADIMRALPLDTTVNPKFVQQALDGGDFFTIYVFDNDGLLIFDGGNVMAAVSPMKHYSRGLGVEHA